MTIISKLDNPNISIVLDSVIEITKGDCIRTCADTYYGFHCINFRTNGKPSLVQWDYGRSKEGEEMRDADYQRIIQTK